VTGEELRREDLMDLKTNPSIQPRPPTATSIPGLIQLFQNEWDAVMLETHMLNKHLDSVDRSWPMPCTSTTPPAE